MNNPRAVSLTDLYSDVSHYSEVQLVRSPSLKAASSIVMYVCVGECATYGKRQSFFSEPHINTEVSEVNVLMGK